MKTISKKLYITLFIVALCLPWFCWALFGKYMDNVNYENRDMVSKPVFQIDTYGSYASDYELYFNDNLPFRNWLISLNSRLKYYLFHSSANDDVIVGKEGWLFYANADDGNPVACYQGLNLYEEGQLQEIAANLTCIDKYLKKKGIEFVVFVAPNKERVYPEMMPEFYGKPAEEYAALQVVDYIKTYTDVRVVYPYEELMKAKEKLGDRILYHKADTHWNYLGAYVGSTALLRELGIEMPEITGNQISISEIENIQGDLADMLNMGKDFQNKESDYMITRFDDHEVVNDEWEFFNHIVYHSTGADERKMYMVRDSFCSAMSAFLGSQFNDSCMTHYSSYCYSDFLSQFPDIFVMEVVERSIGTLGTFDIFRERTE